MQPHRSEYWLFPKIENWDIFKERVSKVCGAIRAAVEGEDTDCELVSVDEKTSIQAKKRIAKDQSMDKGRLRRLEGEYKRNGSRCLTGAFSVGGGKVVNHVLSEERKEEDFLSFIKGTVEVLSEKREIIFMLDQLNTHRSASLVEWIAEKNGYKGELGKKGCRGILKSMKSRQEFLERPEHRIKFLFTPRHCSWLNPIEIWFGKLQRHVIRYGNFEGVEDLIQKIENYIVYYNKCLVKKLNWKFEGFTKDIPIEHIKG